MTRRLFLLFHAFLVLAILLSCGKQTNGTPSHGERGEDENHGPVSFDKSKGLLIIPETQKAIGLRTEEVSEPIQMPHQALVSTSTGDFVYIENEGRYLRQAVVKGAPCPGGWEILDGLFAGDRVVVEPAWWLYLIELQAVRAGSHCH